MQNKWNKEDREIFNKSEVMMELESRVVEAITRAEALLKKRAQDVKQKIEEVKALGDAADEVNAKIEGLAQNLAEDDVVNEASDETAEDSLEDEVVDDLRSLAVAAINDGDIKLAYRIERTIDEILEEGVSCE